MAGHDDELQRLSRFSDFFDDTESRFKDGKLSIAKSLLEGASDVTEVLEAVEDEMQNIYRQQERLSSAGALYESILEDQAAQIAKQAEKERKRAKDRMKIELEIKKIEKDRADLSDKEQKAADKKLKILQKQLTATERIQKAEKAVETATSAAKDTYGSKLEQRKNLAEEVQEASKLGVDLIKDGFKSLDFGEIFSGMKLALTGGLTGGAGFVKALDNVVSAIGNLSKKLDKTIEEIVAYKSDWDTRLFGSDKSYSSVVDAISKSVGASPFVKESDVMKKLNEAIDKGIAYNVEQRAFLQTIKDDIATTFDAFDSTLLQIVRVQQSDSTAARLGMETALNQYLNSMFSTTEYLTNVSDSVTNAIYEATSLLSSQQSIGFEYQVQK